MKKIIGWIIAIVIVTAITVAGCISAMPDDTSDEDVTSEVGYNEVFNASEQVALWTEPASDPVEAAIATYENEGDKDITVAFEFYGAMLDEDETAYRRGLLKGSDAAVSNGWTDEFLDEHFAIVYIEYYVEYDHSQSYVDDGYTGRYIYLVEYDGLWYPYDASGQCGYQGIFEPDGRSRWTKDDVAAYKAATEYLEENFADVELCGYELDYAKALTVIKEYPELAEERGWRWTQWTTYDYTFYVVYAEYSDGDSYSAVWLWMEKDLDTGEWSCYKADTDVELEEIFID